MNFNEYMARRQFIVNTGIDYIQFLSVVSGEGENKISL